MSVPGDSHHAADDRLMTAYLLDRLPSAEREAVEDRFFADDEFASRMLEHEVDLVDALAAGALDDTDAQTLRSRLELSADGRQRLAFARALHERRMSVRAGIAPAPPVSPPLPARSWALPAWLPIAASVVLAVGLGYFAIENQQLRRALDDRTTPLPGEPVPAPAPVPTPSQVSVTVVLDPQRTRGAADRPSVERPAGVEVIHLVLPVADDAPSFDVRIETSPGGVLVSEMAGATKNATGAVDVWVGAGLLPAGDYEVLLSAVRGADRELVGQYAFRITATPGRPSP
ncbi:MAG: hypothetical protein R2745_21800 [Vicinamibacterales bacterium]